MRTRRVLVLLVSVAALWALPAGLAAASCALDPRPIDAQVESAEIVFKGQVVALSDGQRTARFHVEEVWKGTVATEVLVHGGPEQPLGGVDAATSVDRHWEPGATYLVFPQRDGDTYRDNSCSPTTTWQQQLADARPDDWQEPVAVSDTRESEAGADVPVGLLAVAGVVVVATLAVTLLAGRVTTRGRRGRGPR